MIDLKRECDEADFRVVKTIRFNAHNLDLSRLPPETKVLVLVRDPLAVANSLAKGGGEMKEFADVKLICVKANAAFDAAWKYKDKILLILYQDLIRHPTAEILRMAKFFGLKEDNAMTEAMIKAARARMTKNKVVRKRRSISVPFEKWRKSNAKKITYRMEYYDTQKSDGFNSESWKQELTDKFINQVRNMPECKRTYKEIANYSSRTKI